MSLRSSPCRRSCSRCQYEDAVPRMIVIDVDETHLQISADGLRHRPHQELLRPWNLLSLRARSCCRPGEMPSALAPMS